jgi:hypothetical protein
MKKIVFATFLLASCAVFSLAKTDGAILAAAEQVQVNGQQSTRSSTVFPGDRVQTGQKGYALIRTSESLVSMGVDSWLKYDGASVTLERGVTTVTASKGMEAHFGNLVITTDPQHTSKFTLVSVNGLKRIAALEGSLKVSDGTHVANLTAGEMMVPAPPDDPTAPYHSALPGWAIEIMIEAAIAGGVIGGLAASGALFSGKPASPSKP